MEVVIRSARLHETVLLADVERDGDRRYAGYDGLPPGFDDTVAPSTLEDACGDGRLWVVETDDGEIVGFALAESVDGHAHLSQLSVRLAFQGAGLGRRLVTTVCTWARDHAMTEVTLCTFADVDWNRPLYEHLGFVVLPEAQWTPGLRAVFASDADLGLDLARRVVMRLEVPED
ncbi:MAG TPA: GNAT family N-acetyltransferase [Acidimicrobiales bacterium]|nr:GNAT family N-acetyltransferase [Acidimicrobiales bacterium]